jgi:hypothetical protein
MKGAAAAQTTTTMTMMMTKMLTYTTIKMTNTIMIAAVSAVVGSMFCYVEQFTTAFNHKTERVGNDGVDNKNLAIPRTANG